MKESHAKADDPEVLFDMPTAKYLNAYSSKEKTIFEKLVGALAEKNFFESKNLNEYLSTMTKDSLRINEEIENACIDYVRHCFIQRKLFWSIR